MTNTIIRQSSKTLDVAQIRDIYTLIGDGWKLAFTHHATLLSRTHLYLMVNLSNHNTQIKYTNFQLNLSVLLIH